MNSAHAAKAVFSHRHNVDDHTFDSICHTCFRTIATEPSEAALGAHELQHNCGVLARRANPALENKPYSVTVTAG